MNTEQLERMKTGKGFIAALDQSGGSTPKALADYGVSEDSFSTEEEMFDLMHAFRTRMITSPSFSSEYILASILFKQTMESQIEGMDTADYLWNERGIVPILKVDSGLADEANGVQLMKPMPELDALLARGKEKHIFGTKMRSVIKENNLEGITAVVDQQFELAKQIIAADLVPIIEPEVDIHSADKAAIEAELVKQLISHLDRLNDDQHVMLKLTLPETDNLYADLISHPNIVRVIALSGGYPQDEANGRLARNNGLIASFNRALSNGLSADQSDNEFNNHIKASIESIYEASIT